MNAVITWVRANAGAWVATVWQWLAWTVGKLWASVAALIKSPAVWLACGLVFVVGFSAGHIERGSAIRPLKMTIAGLENDKAELQQQLDASKTKVRMLATELEKLAQKPQETAPLISAPTPAPRPRRALRATPAPAKADPGPVRNPFEG